MATVSGDSSRSLAVGGWSVDGDHDSKSERYLAKRLAAASSDYKGVALITFILAAAVGTLAWLAVGVVLEHWVIPGGLPRWARWAWLAAWAVALIAAIVRWIVPLVRYRVNLVYAARVIERDHPDLHNDLVNAVLVRAHPESSAPMVVRSLERRAAKRLAAVPTEGVIDRGPAVRLAAVLAVLVALACVYQIIGPKSVIASCARLLAPWSSITAPARVQVAPPRLHWRMPGDERAADGDALDGQRLAVEGGAATLVRGRQLVVVADIRGLRRDERPVLEIVPMRDDGSIDPAAAPWQAGMERRRTGAGETFVAVLPDAVRGIDHGLEFVLAAGDARSDVVRIAVVDSPALLVREVRYEHPPYTRLPAETIPWQGDVRGVEGTRVTVVAESNRPLEAAWIEFDGAGKRDRTMKVAASDLARATGSFELQMNADRSRPEHESYRLVFRPRGAGGAKEDPIADQMDHRIEVVADLAPEVSIEDPRESPLRVPADAPVTVRVRAVDPDFGLARVGVEMRIRDGKPLPDLVILDRETTGGFKGLARFVPVRLGVAGGTAIEYRAVAVDTRPHQPNVAHSPWQTVVIDPSAPPQSPPKQDPQAGDRDDRDRGDGQSDKRADKQGAEQTSPPDQPREGDAGGAAAPQEGGQADPQNGGQRDGDRQPQKNQPQKKSAAKEPEGKDDPGEQSGASDGSQGGQQQSKNAGDAGAKQQGAGQSGGSQKQEGGDRGGQQRGGGQQGQPQRDQQRQGSQQGGAEGGRQQGQQPARQQEGSGAQPGTQPNGQAGQQKPRDTVAADGTNDGEAMERILAHKQQQDGSPPQDGSGQRQDGGEKPESGADTNGQPPQQNGQCAGADGKPCGKAECSSCKGGGGSTGQAAGQRDAGKQADGDTAGQQSGGKETGKQPGQGQQEGGRQPGTEPETGDGQPAGQQGNSGEQRGDRKQNGASQQGQQGQQGQRTQAADERGEGGDRSADNAGNGKEAGQQPNDKPSSPRDDAAGNAAEAGPGGEKSSAGKRGGTEAGEASGGQPGAPQPGQPSDQVSPTGRGGWSNGERQAATNDDAAEAPPAKETEWVEQELARARNAADLAIEHLRKSVAEGRRDVLDQLGWTPEQARAFLERWDAMRRLAGSDDPRQRGEFERAIRSLGLRPEGVRSSRDVPADVKGGQAEGRRSRPPSEYRDQVKAYLQGTTAE